MPTGYTAKLMEEGQSFQEFAIGCARAFGACIMMRDDPDAPIPERFEPSTYHDEVIQQSLQEIARLNAMTERERLDWGAEAKFRALKNLRECIEKWREENGRLDIMEAAVKDWKPPTPKHDEFKKFMLEQIAISRNSDEFTRSQIQHLTEKTPLQYFEEHLHSQIEQVGYYKVSREQEINRVNERNEWLKALRDSLREMALVGGVR